MGAHIVVAHPYIIRCAQGYAHTFTCCVIQRIKRVKFWIFGRGAHPKHTMKGERRKMKNTVFATLKVEQLEALKNNCTQIDPKQEAMCNFMLRNECAITPIFLGSLETKNEYILCAKNGRIQILDVQHTRLFARHLGELLKQNYALSWCKNNKLISINWKNWKRIFAQLTENRSQQYEQGISKKEIQDYKNYEALHQEFNSLAARETKSHKRRGYSRSWEAEVSLQNSLKHIQYINDVCAYAQTLLG